LFLQIFCNDFKLVHKCLAAFKILAVMVNMMYY
jgi:hypothetical protein